MTPIFTSNHSIMRSILTLDPPKEEIKDFEPVSIFSICKLNNIKDLYLSDSNFGGFFDAYKNSKKENINLHYGIKFYCCDDITKKDEESKNKEHKVVVWALTTAGVKLLQKLYSKAATEGFYYYPRVDYNLIKEYVGKNNEDLMLTIPFYDSFVFNNLMKLNCNILPDFGKIKPIFFIESHDLPFDDILKSNIKDISSFLDCPTEEVHGIYYYKNKDFKNYLVFRTFEDRNTLNKPNIEYMSSDKFSFESYLTL